MILTESITAYLEAREVAGFAPNTLRNDRKVLGLLASACPAGARTSGLTADDMDRHFSARQRSGCGPNTLNTDLAVIRAYLRWLRGRGLAPVLDPVADRRWNKILNPLKLFVPVDDFDRLLDHADHPVSRMVVSTGLFLFLRASEVAPIVLRDVDLDQGFITVTVQKTSEQDRMPISAEYGAEIDRFMRWYSRTCGPLSPDMHLHPRKYALNGPMAVESHKIDPLRPIGRIAAVVNQALSSAGYPTGGGAREGAHTLRRSGAYALYQELSVNRGHDAAIRIVSTMLHHADISMTEKYLDLRLDRVTRNKLIRGKRMFTGEGVPRLTVVQ